MRLCLAHQGCGHVCKEIAELKARVGEGLHDGDSGAAGTRPNLGDRQRLLVPRHLDDGGDYKAIAVIGNWVALVERRHKLARSAGEQKLQRRYLAGKHPAVGFEAAAGDRHEGREPRRARHQVVLGACEVLQALGTTDIQQSVRYLELTIFLFKQTSAHQYVEYCIEQPAVDVDDSELAAEFRGTRPLP